MNDINIRKLFPRIFKMQRNSHDSPYTISTIANTSVITVSIYRIIIMLLPRQTYLHPFFHDEKTSSSSSYRGDDCPLLLLATQPERWARLSASSLSCIQRTFRITCSPMHHAPMTGPILIWEEKNSLRPGRGVVVAARWIPTVDRATGIG